MEFFKQLKAHGDRGISDDTIELVETIADSLAVNESFKQASVQVSIPFVRNSRKYEIVEIKRLLKGHFFFAFSKWKYISSREGRSIG